MKNENLKRINAPFGALDSEISWEVELFPGDAEKGIIKRFQLKEMPFDKYNDEQGFIHHTGYEIMYANGSVHDEWEDEDDDE